MDDANARVARGAALLDEKRPGWSRGLFLGRLRMKDVTLCVLGQLYGDYEAGLEALIPGDHRGLRGTFARRHGFLGTDESDDDALAAAWRAEAEKRSRNWIGKLWRRFL